MRDGQLLKLTVILFAMLGSFSLFGQIQQTPSQKYPLYFEDDDGEEYYFDTAWMSPLPDGGFIGRAFDVAWMYHLNADLDPVSVWQLRIGITNSGILPNGSLLHFSFDINQAIYGVPPGTAQVVAEVVLTTADGALLGQHALLFQDGYNTSGPPIDLGNRFIDSNGQGESFLHLESDFQASNILKLGPTGQPLWQVRLPAGKIVYDGPYADVEGGCWVGLYSNSDLEVLHLDSSGNVVFWNQYDRPGSLSFGWGSSLYSNGYAGLTICGLDSTRLFWMNIDPLGQVSSYRIYPSISYPNYLNFAHQVVSMGWTGANWAMSVGGAIWTPDMVLFCEIDGTPERAYSFSGPIQVGDTLTLWRGKVEYTRRPRAVLTGSVAKQNSSGYVFEPDVTVTVLPAGPWEHCMVQELPVPVELLFPPAEIVVTPVPESVTHLPLPVAVPMSITPTTLPMFSHGPLCVGPLGVEEVQKAPDLWVEQTVVDRGAPLRFQAGGHIALMDPAGRFVMPWTKMPDRMGSLATGQLAPGVYLLVLRAEDDMAVRVARVVVQ